jgi:hypothetical protein
MATQQHFATYRGYRLYLPKAGGFPKDALGCYLVNAMLSKFGSRRMEIIPIPGCRAASFDDAAILSIEHAMRLIDDGVLLMMNAGRAYSAETRAHPGANRKA